MKSVSPILIQHFVKEALSEDLGRLGDVTSEAIFSTGSISIARIVVKKEGVLSGLEIAAAAFQKLDRSAKIIKYARDSAPIRPGQTILTIKGKTQSILSAERVALNFLQRLSGIATLTHQFVLKTKSKSKTPKILDTRKTTPLLRVLEKYAVRCGGGTNHRYGLYDLVLIKDNHLAALSHYEKPVLEAVKRCHKRWPKLKIEVECDTLSQVKEALEANADIILLDNMNPSQLKRAVCQINGRAKTEASGGINLKSIKAIAQSGVDFISVGALTHSAPSIDFSLEVDSHG